MTCATGGDFEDNRGPPTRSNAYDGRDLLLATLRSINADGWVPRSKEALLNPSTISKVDANYNAFLTNPPTRAELEEIDAALTWVASPEAGDSDYITNLRTLLTPDQDGIIAIHHKHAALVASAIASHRTAGARAQAHAERAKTDEAKRQAILAEPGTNLKGLGVTATVLGARLGQDYGYGAPLHVTMLDSDGHVLYWKASASTTTLRELEDGSMWDLTEGVRIRTTGGTVKDNRVSDFNGDWETVLTRMKFDPIITNTDGPARVL